MVEAECHRCGYEWNYTGESEHYGCCPNCKTSVQLHGGSERAEPSETAERCPDPSDRTKTVEVAAGDDEPREVPVAEAVEAMDGAVSKLYTLGEARAEATGDLAERVEETEESVDELRAGLVELAGYFEELIEEFGGELEYDEISAEESAVAEAVKAMEVDG